MSAHFPKSYIRALDRGYDAGFVFDYFVPRDEKFIVRMKYRTVLYKNKIILLKELVNRFKGKHSLKFEAKSGKKANCKMSIIAISLPDHADVQLNVVVCHGLGKEPLILLTNLESADKRLCVTVVKVYLMRWRIEEYYKFKKQSFGFEKLLVKSLKSIRNLDLLLSIAIGYIGILSEKIDESIEVREIIRLLS